MMWGPNVTVAAILEREGRFLFVEEDADGRIVYNQPAGHLDPGETLLQACARETLEETGWTMEPTALVGAYLLEARGGATTYLRFCFAGRLVAHDPARKLDTEIRRIVWLTRDELVAESAKHRSQLVLRCVDDYLAGRRFPLDFIHDTRLT
ncbi:MAG: NUDIX hydrolase [Gammaproteobacteria bacterium]|nr:NUDIX hydrolase [Gammaproteobacteria bacterium]MBI5616384.1 NUDIX hydrolase [Gammaproteobacteria bacterium]